MPTPEPGFDVSVVTITYNERENIARLIQELNRVFSENQLTGEIIVVDDSSPDGTGDVIRQLQKDCENLKLISRPALSGIGSAYRDGLSKTQGSIIVTMDADLSHPPSALAAMLAAAKQGYIAIGSRFRHKSGFSTEPHRLIAALITNTVARLLLKTGVQDHTNGFLALKRSDLDRIQTLGLQLGIDPFTQVLYGTPILALANQIEIPMIEIPAPYRFRIYGASKIGLFRGVRYIMHHAIHIFTLWRILKKNSQARPDSPI